MAAKPRNALSLVPIHSIRALELRLLVAHELSNEAAGLPRPASPQEAATWLRQARRSWAESLAYTFGIHMPDVGLVGLTRLGLSSELAGVLSYWVASPHRGQGCATQAAQLTLAFAWERLGLERVSVLTAEDNVASQRLARRLGFRRKGADALTQDGEAPA